MTDARESHIRAAEWHAFEALKQSHRGQDEVAKGHLESAIEWLTMAGVACGRVTDPTEICGLAARLRTGVLQA